MTDHHSGDHSHTVVYLLPNWGGAIVEQCDCEQPGTHFAVFPFSDRIVLPALRAAAAFIRKWEQRSRRPRRD
jgi:hypothetical protein